MFRQQQSISKQTACTTYRIKNGAFSFITPFYGEYGADSCVICAACSV